VQVPEPPHLFYRAIEQGCGKGGFPADLKDLAIRDRHAQGIAFPYLFMDPAEKVSLPAEIIDTADPVLYRLFDNEQDEGVKDQ